MTSAISAYDTLKTCSFSIQDLTDRLYTQNGCPMYDRSQSVAVMHALCGVNHSNGNPHPPPTAVIRPPLSNVYGEGPLVLSDIPGSCKNLDGGVVLGVDEAGRGSLVGPMIYGMAFWHPADEKMIPKDFNDSKQLSEQQREKLFETILKTPEMGFCTRVLHASEISRNMLRREPYNLNQMSHDAAIAMIRSLVDCKVTIKSCYIDTVGNPASYTRRLEKEFPGIEFIVESKADDKYAPCSAASIVAKVVRDRMTANWMFSEPALADTRTNFGSGYPSDPACKAWMKAQMSDNIFGFADAVRFSWGPAKKQLVAEATAVTFVADCEGDNDGEETKHRILLGKKRQQEQMSAFLSGKSKQKRLPYFERKRLQIVTKL